jgi:hypothetical protein
MVYLYIILIVNDVNLAQDITIAHYSLAVARKQAHAINILDFLYTFHGGCCSDDGRFLGFYTM